MARACTTSPFSALNEDMPWIIWAQKTSVNELLGEKQTERRSENTDNHCPEEDSHGSSEGIVSPPIQRMQYHAVLSRINQAKNKTGSFSAWNN